MRVEKEKRKVNIVCNDGSFVIGNLHINPGERLFDHVNDAKEPFVVVTEAQFHNIGLVHSFKMYNDMVKKNKAVILNKSSIKWIEEIDR